MTRPIPAGTALFTTLALLAFAANSILCRLALRAHAIDPATFTAVRLFAGAATLAILVSLRRGTATQQRGSWLSAAALFCYAAPFSFAYLSLGAGTGALILFGAVQLTMLLVAIRRGQRPRPIQWFGIIIAFGGLAWLLLPGITAPSPIGAALMLAAGASWGIYSLRGHGATDALGLTTGNFARSLPFVLALWLVALSQLHVEPSGILWATLSGAVASGIGYAIWYRALPYISSVTAAVVQLSVPLLAGLGGILLLGEQLTLRLAVAAILVLGGIGVTILGRRAVA